MIKAKIASTNMANFIIIVFLFVNMKTLQHQGMARLVSNE